MAADMELFWGSGSSPCWSAMIVLEEKGLSGYKSHMISFSKKEHKEENVTKLNPRGQVPTFRHGNVVVNESMAICDYLEGAFKTQGTTLLPSDPAQLAAVLQRKYESINIRKKIMEDYMYPKWQNKLTEEEAPEKREALLAELAIWEGYLEKLGDGSHIAGKDFSMADVQFFPMLAFSVRVGLKLAPRFPRLQAYHDMVNQRPTIQASSPPHWKDSPAGTQLADV